MRGNVAPCFYAFIVFSGVAASAIGQSAPPADEVLLNRVKREVAAQFSSQREASPRALEDALTLLSELRPAAAKTREDTCKWLASLVKRLPKTPSFLRVRFACIHHLGALAEDVKWVEFLLDHGAPAAGFDIYYERALAALRHPRHKQALFQVVVKRRDQLRRAILSLGGLSRSQDLVHQQPEGDERRQAVEALKTWATSRHREARIPALRVLARVEGPAAFPRILEALEHSEARLRLAAIRCLGDLAHLPGVSALMAKSLDDELPLIREEASLSLGATHDIAVVPKLVQAMEGAPLRQRLAIAQSLKLITGFDFGPVSERWKFWHKSAKASGRLVRSEESKAAAASYAKAPTYYDIPIHSDRIVFVLDISTSMGWSIGKTSKDPNRMEYAQAELIQVLKALDAKSRFEIVFFDQVIRPFKGKLVPATKSNISAAVRAISGLAPRGGTDSHGAIGTAFHHYPQADTIYFLSDGAPTVGHVKTPELIIREVLKWNRIRQVRVHTIALLEGEFLNPMLRKREDREEASRFMRMLADETGGQFVLRDGR